MRPEQSQENVHFHSDPIQKRVRRKRGGGCLRFLIMLIVTVLIALILIITCLGFLARSQYQTWEESFESNVVSQEVIEVGSEEHEKQLGIVEAKLEEFGSSTSNVEFIILAREGFTAFLVDQFSGNPNQNYQVKEYYSVGSQDEWDIYSKIYSDNLIFKNGLWVKTTINKDQIESAEIYSSNITVGDISLAEMGLGFVVDAVNDGYRNALILVNENAYSTREFQNIELETDQIIIKGRLNR